MSKPCKNAKACPVALGRRAEVRWSLALFAMTNYLLGMATFMFWLCSSSPEHVRHLGLMLTDLPAFVEEMGGSNQKTGNHTAH